MVFDLWELLVASFGCLLGCNIMYEVFLLTVLVVREYVKRLVILDMGGYDGGAYVVGVKVCWSLVMVCCWVCCERSSSIVHWGC